MRRRAPFKQAQRQPEIGLDDEIRIGRSGVGNGAEMDDRIELASLKPAEQLAGWHHVGELSFAEIAPFLPGIEGIVDHDVAVAGLVEARHHIRADEPGPAGDQKHRSASPPRPPLPQSDRTCNLAAGARSQGRKRDSLRRQGPVGIERVRYTLFGAVGRPGSEYKYEPRFITLLHEP